MAVKLTPKQEKFVTEYLLDLNGTQAAIRAGYSKRSAEQTSHRLLRNARVIAALNERQKKRAERTEVTADFVLLQLCRIAEVDLRDVMEWGPGGVKLKPSSELNDRVAAAIAEVSETRTQAGGSLKVKLLDRLRALELIGKHLGMWVERHEVTGKDGAPLLSIDVAQKILMEAGKWPNSTS